MQHKTQINTKYKTHTKSKTSLAAQDTEAALNTSSPYNNLTSQEHGLRANGRNSLQPLFYYHANTVSGSSQKPFFQHLMLNHWGLTVEPTDKASEGACFANTNQKEIFFLRTEGQQYRAYINMYSWCFKENIYANSRG